ncbi:CsbD family protein [Tessaracoccus caeni]|uniref:CsbD family protein n=1 Tax=Tessaracoccus caeni TaxID=3031239 RepID=UPI0023DC2CE8|nr:CsbD family protein [Tessaracoccus caeni]MDF1487280.1 CsbD family protein [Tessaracoccus caeni]
MALGDELKAKAEQAVGEVKEGVGDAVGDDQLKAEGKADQISGAIKEKLQGAADKVKDAAEAASDKLEDAVEGIKDKFTKG